MQDALLRTARAALPAAHCPYSGFRVGAAVSTAEGHTFSGVNIENASYGLTVCAERVALWTAVAAGARQLTAIAVTTARPPTKPAQAMPCGACRQVMAEFMGPDALVVVDHVGTFYLESLLPQAFVLR